MNKHEYTKILLMIIRGLFTIIHVEKKRKHEWPRIDHEFLINIYDYSCFFMIILVEKKKKTRIAMNYS